METILKDDFLKLKKYNIENLKIKPEMIIENCALKVLKNINLGMRDTFAVVCGISDNGAIGLATARLLKSEGKFVDLYIVENQAKASDDFKVQVNIIENIEDIHINYLETIEELQNLSSDLKRVNTIIDAITGYEYDSSFSGTGEYIIDCLNKSRIYTISIDIPSGMDYDTGETNIMSVDSELVVTFHKLKKGLLNSNRFEVKLEKIGLIERGKDVRHKAY